MEAEGWKRREVRGIEYIETTVMAGGGERRRRLPSHPWKIPRGARLPCGTRARLPSRMPDNNGKVSLGRERERKRDEGREGGVGIRGTN